MQHRDTDQYGIPVFRKSSSLNAIQLLKFFEARKRRKEPLVLVTVFETQGSTYSKAGARMLIDQHGSFQGMLSGGCLEGDLAVRAKIVNESGVPQTVTYDLGQDDELWGLGIGCDGLMRVFLQPLSHGSGYQPFAALADILSGNLTAVATTIIESTSLSAPAGASVIRCDSRMQVFGMSNDFVEALLAAIPAAADRTSSGASQIRLGDESLLVLDALVAPPPRLLVLGAGLDAEPVVRFAGELGWRCTVVDHRPAYIDNGNFSDADKVMCLPADELTAKLDLSTFDFAIAMSHHLVSDRSYLRQLAATGIAYVGLLGPAGRRERLLAELQQSGTDLQDRLHGPAGLDIGGRGPAAIALSIIAEMHLCYCRDADVSLRAQRSNL